METHSSILVWRTPLDRRAWQATVHEVTELDMTESQFEIMDDSQGCKELNLPTMKARINT